MTTGLTTKELADMRIVSDDFLPDTCTIQTFTETTGGMGGVTGSWANTYENVSCRIDPMMGQNETVTAFALEGKALYTLNIPYTQDISIENRVVHDSVTYEVTSVEDTHSYRTIRRAVLTRVN